MIDRYDIIFNFYSMTADIAKDKKEILAYSVYFGKQRKPLLQSLKSFRHKNQILKNVAPWYMSSGLRILRIQLSTDCEWDSSGCFPA